MKPKQGIYSLEVTYKSTKRFNTVSLYEVVEIIPDTTKDNFESALRFKGYDLRNITYRLINKI